MFCTEIHTFKDIVMSVNETLQTLLSELKHTAKSETVFGEPIAAGETTIIPVSKISFGFTAAGSGKKEGMNGTGGGVQVTPVALISVSGSGKVEVHPIDKDGATNSLISKVIDLAPDVISQVLKTFKKSDK